MSNTLPIAVTRLLKQMSTNNFVRLLFRFPPAAGGGGAKAPIRGNLICLHLLPSQAAFPNGPQSGPSGAHLGPNFAQLGPNRGPHGMLLGLGAAIVTNLVLKPHAEACYVGIDMLGDCSFYGDVAMTTLP